MPTGHRGAFVDGRILTVAVSPDFLVVWADPLDAQRVWRHAKMHWPEAIPRLSFDLGHAVIAAGFARSDLTFQRPSVRRSVLVNGYLYQTAMAAPSSNADERDRVSRALTEVVARDVMAAWRGVLPEVLAHLAALEDFARAGSAAELLLALESGIVSGQRLYEIHAALVSNGMFAIDRFTELYTELFPDRGELAALRLLDGEETKTGEAASALAALARDLAQDRTVRSLIEVTAPEALGAALDGHPEARRKLWAYLDAFGKRTATLDPALPGLAEQPDPVLRELRAHVLEPGPDPAILRHHALAERERLTDAALERLRGYPRAVTDAFHLWLRAARAGTQLMEVHNFFIDYAFPYRIRQIALALGARFVWSGALSAAQDIFHLSLDEVRGTVVDGTDQRALAQERVMQLVAFRRLTPPSQIGDASAAAGAVIGQTRVTGKFFGTPITQTGDPLLIRGNAGSPGRVRANARVVRSFADAERVRSGEVLVAPTTASPWTPLFARIAGIVTDTGGVLSHSAIIAREYRIPAVVGCGDACARIPDGALIEIDGDAGEVRVLDNGDR